MTRQEIFSLVVQVLDAKERLAHVERDYHTLHNKLMQELSERYPLETNTTKG